MRAKPQVPEHIHSITIGELKLQQKNYSDKQVSDMLESKTFQRSSEQVKSINNDKRRSTKSNIRTTDKRTGSARSSNRSSKTVTG